MNQIEGIDMRLLVVEDDRDAADYIVRAFSEVGHIADRAMCPTSLNARTM